MKDPNLVFNQQHAATYDERNAVWAPGRESLLAFIRLIFAELPTQARILCVGVGTGIELVALAEAFPQWQFTAVEPATAMLEVCRQRAEANGLTSRCTFHEGFLDSLPDAAPFDGATCLLVSHFFMDPQERSQFFSQIARRLRPQGLLVSSDLASDMASPQYLSLLDVFIRMMVSPQMPNEEIEKRRVAYGRDVAVIPPPEVEAIIKAGGFENSVLFFQNLLIHAWFSRRA